MEELPPAGHQQQRQQQWAQGQREDEERDPDVWSPPSDPPPTSPLGATAYQRELSRREREEAYERQRRESVTPGTASGALAGSLLGGEGQAAWRRRCCCHCASTPARYCLRLPTSCLPPLPRLLPRCSQQAPADIGGQAQGQHRRQAGGWWQRRWRPQARHAGCAAVGLQLCRPGAGGLTGCLLGFPPAAAAKQVAHRMHSGSARQC
jgi:hypothetical protein